MGTHTDMVSSDHGSIAVSESVKDNESGIGEKKTKKIVLLSSTSFFSSKALLSACSGFQKLLLVGQ